MPGPTRSVCLTVRSAEDTICVVPTGALGSGCGPGGVTVGSSASAALFSSLVRQGTVKRPEMKSPDVLFSCVRVVFITHQNLDENVPAPRQVVGAFPLQIDRPQLQRGVGVQVGAGLWALLLPSAPSLWQTSAPCSASCHCRPCLRVREPWRQEESRALAMHAGSPKPSFPGLTAHGDSPALLLAPGLWLCVQKASRTGPCEGSLGTESLAEDAGWVGWGPGCLVWAESLRAGQFPWVQDSLWLFLLHSDNSGFPEESHPVLEMPRNCMVLLSRQDHCRPPLQSGCLGLQASRVRRGLEGLEGVPLPPQSLSWGQGPAHPL